LNNVVASDTPAIRVRGLGRYFGPRVEMDGATYPREAFRTLLRVAGLRVQDSGAALHVTSAASGDALRDVSFDVDWGSVVCLVGPSGSGKTVLLSILAGVLPPTTGRVEFYGPVTSVLSIGDNLDTRLSAYENLQAVPYIANAGPEAARHIAEILDFAELHGFEHASIRTFSTGMVLRLSIAIALCGRPSIVLIDDVLNVGDIGFQQKCFDRVLALKDAGCTLVVAFSDDSMVRRLATRVVTLGGGQITGDVRPLHWASSRHQGSAANVSWDIRESFPENDQMALRAIAVTALEGDEGPPLQLQARFEARSDGIRCRPLVSVAKSDGGPVLFRSLYPEFVPARAGTVLAFTVTVPMTLLPDGDYTVGLHLASMEGGRVHSLKASNAVAVSVRREHAEHDEERPRSLLTSPLVWEMEPVAEASS
jgi:ABC-type polysaccharide/polyol phosphate transport system ATPase subunit